MRLKNYYIIFCLIINFHLTSYVIAQEESLSVNENMEISDFSDKEDDDELTYEIDEEIPRPVFQKPSNLEVFFRKVGLNIMLTIIDLKTMCAQKFQNCLKALKIMRYTL